MAKVYPLNDFEKVVGVDGKLTVKINPSLEGISPTLEMMTAKSVSGLKKLLSFQFCWLPSEVVEAYNNASTPEEKKEVLVKKVYGNCKLNCPGCYAKKDDLFQGRDLIHPEAMIDLIEEAVRDLGTESVTYLGPTEFFRDVNVFKHLDRLATLDVIINIFAKDPMFGSDKEVETLFGNIGIHTSEEFIKKLASYKKLRILFNFRTFDEELTNKMVRGGYAGKEDYVGNYKTVQTRALQLLYRYFAVDEFGKGREARLVIINTPIVEETIEESPEIFKYFTDFGLLVTSTTSMQSGCGGKIYRSLGKMFLRKFAEYYATVINHSVKRGIIAREYVEKYGPSPYAGTFHCFQLCNGILMRETGVPFRCPGADHSEWRDNVSPEDLVSRGIVWAWKRTRNYAEPTCVNIGCKAKDRIFTDRFNAHVMQLLKKIEE